MPWYEYSTSTGAGNTKPYVTVHLWHGARKINVIALVDSGADTTMMDSSYADVLGLNKAEAIVDEGEMANGSPVRVFTWPDKPIEIQFENDRFPFKGGFVEFAAGAEPENLLGRDDFFQRYIVQFWDAAQMMNIDTSPDHPRDPHPRPDSQGA